MATRDLKSLFAVEQLESRLLLSGAVPLLPAQPLAPTGAALVVVQETASEQSQSDAAAPSSGVFDGVSGQSLAVSDTAAPASETSQAAVVEAAAPAAEKSPAAFVADTSVLLVQSHSSNSNAAWSVETLRAPNAPPVPNSLVTVILSGDTYTNGNDAIFNANVVVDSGKSITISTGPQGGNIIIEGKLDGVADLGGLAEDLTLIGGTGNIIIKGDIGSVEALNSLTIVSAGTVTFSGNINVRGQIKIINTSGVIDLGAPVISGNPVGNVTAGSIDIATSSNVIFEGNLRTTSGGMKFAAPAQSGSLTFKQNVTCQGALEIVSARDVTFGQAVNVYGALKQTTGSGLTLFAGAVTADSFDLTTAGLTFDALVSVNAGGNMVFSSNEINFTGGANSVTSAGLDTSVLTLRPVSSVIPIRLGTAAGVTLNTLDLSPADLAAISSRFKEVHLGWDGPTDSVATAQFASTTLSSGGSAQSAATVEIRSPLGSNDLLFTAAFAGTAYNGVIVQLFDDGTLTNDAAVARYYSATKILTVNVHLYAGDAATATKAATVLDAVNNHLCQNDTAVEYTPANRPFTASAGLDYTTGAGYFATVISDLTAGAFDDAAATALLRVSGGASDIKFTASTIGTTSNGVTFALLNRDVSTIEVAYDAGKKVFTIKARLSDSPSGAAHTVAQIITAINTQSGLPFAASADTSNPRSTGDLEIGQATLANPLIAVASSVTVSGDVDVPDKLSLEGLYGGVITLGASALTTTDLSVLAAGPIQLNTLVSSLSAGTSANGDLLVNQTGPVTVKNLATVKGNLSFLASGAVTLSATGSGVSGAGGNVLVYSLDSIIQNAAITTTQINTPLPSIGGAIYVRAVSGSITMAASVTTASNGGNIRYAAGASVALAVLNAGTGLVSVVAGGAIADQNLAANNIVAARLRLESGANIATAADPLEINVDHLAAQSSSHIFLREANGLIIDSVTVTVTYLNANLTPTDVTDSSLDGLIATSDGLIMVEVSLGALVVNQPVIAQGAGNLRLAVLEITQDISVNNTVSASGGSLTVLAGRNVLQSATGALSTDGGSIDVEAANGSVTMTSGASAQTAGGALRYKAALDLAITGLNAGTGAVSLIAVAGAITDAGNASKDVAGAQARLVAATGVGTGGNALDLAVDTLAARTATGGLYLSEADSLAVDTVGPIVANRVGANGIATALPADAALSDLVVSASGNIVLLSLNGALTLNDGSAAADGLSLTTPVGNVLVSTQSTGANDKDLLVNAAINVSIGSLTLLANRNIALAAAGDLTVGGAGTIDVEAQNGTLAMTDGAVIRTNNAPIRAKAAGDITVGGFNAGTSDVSLISTSGSILDNGDTDKDVQAGSVRLFAGNGIGNGADLLDLTVATVAAQAAGGGIYLAEDDGLILGAVGPLTVNRVIADGTTPVAQAQTDTLLNGLTTVAGNGRIVLLVLNGSLAVNQPVQANGSGNLLLQTSTTAANDKDITLSAAVASGTGRIAIVANRTVSQTAAGDIATTGGTIDVEAQNGSITMTDGAVAQTSGGSLRYQAFDSIALASLNAGAGDVSIIASNGSVTDNGDTDKDVLAGKLRITAAVGIGASTDVLDVNVTTLAARAAGGGIYLSDVDALTIGSVGPVVTYLVTSAGTTFIVQDPLLTGATTIGGNGNIVIKALAGSLTTTQSVVADGTGNILLAAQGAGSDLSVGNPIVTPRGCISLSAVHDLFQTAAGDISALSGTIDVEAGNSISMSDGALSQTSGGSIRYAAGVDVGLGGLNAGTGNVEITAGRDITDNGDTDKDVVANSVRLSAVNGVGVGNPLELAVGTAAAQAGAGGIYLSADSAFALGTVAGVQVQRVGDTGTLSAYPAVAAPALSGAVTTGGGNIILQSVNATLNINQPISASGGGNILLQVTSTGANDKDLVLNAAVASGSGNITVLANRDATFAAGAALSTGGGSVLVVASSGVISMASGSSVTSGGGNIRYLANLDITLAGVNAGSGDISINSTNGSILDGGDTTRDLSGNHLRLTAGVSVGAAANALETSVAFLAAQAGTSGVFARDSDALAVDLVSPVIVSQVQSDGAIILVSDAADLSGIVTATGSGSIVLQTQSGALNVKQTISANGSGNILLNSTGALTLEAAVLTGSGSITLLSTGDLHQLAAGDVTTGGAGTIDAESVAGSITMDNGAVSKTSGGAIRYRAALNVALGGLNAGSGDASVAAVSGSITDNGDLDKEIQAGKARLVAGSGIGAPANALDLAITTLAARAAGGGVYLAELDALTVDVCAVTVNRVDTDGSTPVGLRQVDASLSGVATIAGGGNIVLTPGGTLTVNQPVAADSLGNVRLAVSSGYDLSLNAAVSSGSGNLTLRAGRNLSQTASGDFSTGGAGTVDVEAVAGSITMADGATSQTAAGSLRYQAAVDLTVGGLSSATGNLSLTAVTGSILDGGDSQINVAGAGLRLWAGLGIGTLSGAVNAIETAVVTLSARAVADGIFVIESDALTIDTVPLLSVNRVDVDGTTPAALVQTDAAQSDVITSTNGGAIVLRTLNGNLTVNDGSGATNGIGISANGTGNIRLETGTTAANDKSLTLNSSVVSSSGKISLLANGSLFQAAAGDVVTAGTIDAEAFFGAITMANGALSQTTGASIRYKAATNVALGGLDAGSGDVSVIAVSGSITDNGDTDKEILSGRMRLFAGTAVGAGANALDTNSATLAARAGAGGLYLLNDTTLTIDAVGAITVSRVDVDGSTPLALRQIDSAMVDVRTTAGDGNIVLVSLNGNLAVNQSVVAFGDGNIRLAAQTTGADDKDILLGAAVSSTTGDISILANRDVKQSVVGALTSGGGSIDVQAAKGSITMQNGVLTQSLAGSIRYWAANDVSICGLSAGTGKVSVIAATGSILDKGDANKDISASSARLVANVAIGSAANPLDTAVATLAARAGAGGFFVAEDDAIVIDTVGPVTVNRVAEDGTTPVAQQKVDAALSDLVSASHLVLLTLNGSITVNDGTAPADGIGVSSGGTGNILLLSQSTLSNDKNVVLNAAVKSTKGSISVIANQHVLQNASGSLFAGGTGTLDVEALNGSITMAASALGQTLYGNIRYQAALDVTLGGLHADSGSVSLIAVAGSILDGGDTYVNVFGNGLRVVAANSFGTLGAGANAIETTVANFTARAGAGGVNLLATDSVSIASVAVTVNVVGTSGTATAFTDLGQSDVVTSSNGAIVLRSANGSIAVFDGNSDSLGLVANGTGNILLETQSANSDLILRSGVKTGSGSISLLSGRHVNLAAGVKVQSAGAGSLEISALTGSVVQAADSALETSGGDISLTAYGPIVTATIDARVAADRSVASLASQAAWGNVAVTSDNSSIISASSASRLYGKANLLKAASRIGGANVALYQVMVSGDLKTWSPLVTFASEDAQVRFTDPMVASGMRFYEILSSSAVKLKGKTLSGRVVELSWAAATAVTGSLPLRTETSILSAQAAGGLQIEEATDFAVDQAVVVVNRVGADARIASTSSVSQSDVKNTAAGSLILRALAGAITVNDGANADSLGIALQGAGPLLVQAGGGNLVINSQLSAAQGSLSLLASQGLQLNSTVNVGGAASTIDLSAAGGSLTLAASARITSAGGNLRLAARDDVNLTGLNAGSGLISIIAATGSILDSGEQVADLVASQVRLQAGQSIGQLANGFETNVARLSALASNGVINLVETDALVIDSVGAVAVNRVAADASLSAVSDAAQADLVSGGSNGAILLRTLNGALTLNDGDTNTVAVSAAGAGRVLLQAGGANALILNASLSSGSGALSLLAGTDLTLAAGVKVQTGGAGTLDLNAAAGNIVMGLGSLLQTQGANVRVAAAQSITLSVIDTRTAADRTGNTLANQAAWGQVSLIAANGSILDADTTPVNLYASSARLVATVSLGTVANPIETELITLAASAGAGGFAFAEQSNVNVGPVAAVTVGRVQNDGTLVNVSDSGSLDGVTKTGGAGNIDTANQSGIGNFPALATVTLTGTSAPNTLSSLYEQVVTLSNPTGSTIDAIRLLVQNVPAGAKVENAYGLLNGVPYLQINQSIPVGGSLKVTIEYYVPTPASIPTAVTLVAQVVPPVAALNPVGTLVSNITVARAPATNEYVVVFMAEAGKSYYVQYSDDGTTWQTALAPVVGRGQYYYWIDNGPPETNVDSSTLPVRYYRVILV